MSVGRLILQDGWMQAFMLGSASLIGVLAETTDWIGNATKFVGAASVIALAIGSAWGWIDKFRQQSKAKWDRINRKSFERKMLDMREEVSKMREEVSRAREESKANQEKLRVSSHEIVNNQALHKVQLEEYRVEVDGYREQLRESQEMNRRLIEELARAKADIGVARADIRRVPGDTKVAVVDAINNSDVGQLAHDFKAIADDRGTPPSRKST